MRNGKVKCYYMREEHIRAIKDFARQEDVSENVAMRKFLTAGIIAVRGSISAL